MLSGTNILIVDDEPAVCMITRRILTGRGARVESVMDGKEAVDLVVAQQCAFDLALIDLTMPSLSGKDIYTTLQTGCPGLKMILMSGYPEETALQGFEEKVPFLQKPFTAAALLEKVGECLHPS